MEEKFGLLDHQIEGVYFWKIIRFQLFLQITRKLGVYGQAHPPKGSILSRLKTLPLNIWNSYRYGSVKGREPREILIFQHPRKKLVDGRYIDIYTHNLIEQLEDEGRNYEIIDIMYQNSHLIRAGERRSYDDHFFLSSLLRRIFRSISLDEQSDRLLGWVENEIKNIFDINISLKKEIKQRIKIFLRDYQYYRRLISIKKPEKVYLVVSYGLEPLIAACRESGVETVELQHGVINRYHLGYSYPGRDRVPYFPGRMLLFSRFWYRNTPIPLPPEKTGVYGFPYLEEMRRRYAGISPTARSVIVISQGTIGSRLSGIAARFAQKYSDFNIIYKLHPGEYSRWREEYPHLVEAEKLANFSVVDNSNINLYRYLAESEYLVGVYSTVIYEGLMFDCKTILMNLPGIDYMEYLINNNYARLADQEDDIIRHIREDNFIPPGHEKIFGR